MEYTIEIHPWNLFPKKSPIKKLIIGSFVSNTLACVTFTFQHQTSFVISCSRIGLRSGLLLSSKIGGCYFGFSRYLLELVEANLWVVTY